MKEHSGTEKGNRFMLKLARGIVDKRKLIFLFTLLLLIFSVFSSDWVKVENALEACAASKTPRFIRLHIRQRGTLYLTMDNTSDQPPLSDEKRLISSKHDGFGIGTESVRMTAESYNGDARFEWREGVFYASVMLSSAD